MKYKQGMNPNSKKTQFKMGHSVSEKTRLAVSKLWKGKIGNRLGSHPSKETREKMSKSHRGHVAWNKGTVGIVKAWNKGKTHEDDPRIARPWLGKPRLNMRGKKSNLWKGHNNKTAREKSLETLEYKTWRMKVFERDGFTCQKCGIKRCKGNRIILNAHHILPFKDFPEYEMVIDNGITLCSNCHNLTINNEWKYVPMFMNI